MKEDPNKNWPKIRKWARPMNQLHAGVFMNMTGGSFKELEEQIIIDGQKSEELRLEMSWIDKGYVRIRYDTEGK